ncbi:unnamed protein product [Dovyalis caffra]|uniref:Uncharacterized protein n=1 Tax=Dovyalis caffra TaxID=77055 RepID=A0AAV1SHK7_9ROSI|nr:unnamed protein product [Dovyalis caffra]
MPKKFDEGLSSHRCAMLREYEVSQELVVGVRAGVIQPYSRAGLSSPPSRPGQEERGLVLDVEGLLNRERKGFGWIFGDRMDEVFGVYTRQALVFFAYERMRLLGRGFFFLVFLRLDEKSGHGSVVPVVAVLGERMVDLRCVPAEFSKVGLWRDWSPGLWLL